MGNIEQIFDELKNEIPAVAGVTLNKYIATAVKDAENFLQKIRPDITKWVQMYTEGNISKEELESLIKGKKDIAEMTLLKQKGLGKVTIDRFVNGLIDKIISKFL